MDVATAKFNELLAQSEALAVQLSPHYTALSAQFNTQYAAFSAQYAVFANEFAKQFTEKDEMYVALCLMVLAAVSLVYVGSKRGLASFTGMKSAPETLTAADAAQFPINGSMALFSMYVMVKYIPSAYIGTLMGFYLCVFAVFALNYFVRPILGGNIVVGLASIVTGFMYFYTDKHWMLTNLFGVSIAVMAIQSMVVGTWSTGAILLSGLFFYDIFWVFGTEVMVSVATNIDGPIKILCPQTPITWRSDRMSLLGLGDIVIPGFYIALMCVFSTLGRDYMRREQQLAADEQQKQKGAASSGGKSKVSKKPASNVYFIVAMVAYTLSLVNTMVVMVVFKHAQPALLYIVPWLLITTLLTALVKGELGMLWNFDISMLFVEPEAPLAKAKRLKEEAEAEARAKAGENGSAADEDTLWWIVKDFFGQNPSEAEAQKKAEAEAKKKATDSAVSNKEKRISEAKKK